MGDDRMGSGGSGSRGSGSVPNDGVGGGKASEEARRYYQRQGGQASPERVVPASETSHYGARDGGTDDRPHSASDPHYGAWREQQVRGMDRDYDAYRSEHAADAAHDFGTWRTTRQGQRDAMRQIAEHMEVVGRDGVHVGTVDKIRGDDIVLTRTDPAAGGVHHLIPGAWIQGVGEKVMLAKKGDEARAQWMEDTRDRPAASAGRDDNSLALGESPNQGSGGPHILDRSFAGTYDD